MPNERPPISRQPLREQVYAELLQRIVNAELEPGSQIVEAALTAELGVSRTPLREALFRLEAGGFVESFPARGFFVKPLTTREADEVYPILWTLECLAVRLAHPVPTATLGELERIADARASARRPQRALEFDTQWHDVLVRAAGNERLASYVGDIRRAVRRYESAYMKVFMRERAPTADHHSIIAALRSGDVDRAVARLEQHWRDGLDNVRQRLASG